MTTAPGTLAAALGNVERDPVAAYTALAALWQATLDAEVSLAAARVAERIDRSGCAGPRSAAEGRRGDDIDRSGCAGPRSAAEGRRGDDIDRSGWDGKPDARQAKWLALAPRASELVVRLELIRHLDFEKDRAKDLVPRLEAMADWPADPVVTRWLVDVFARQTRAPFLEGQKCFRRVFALLDRVIDRDGAARFIGWIGSNERRLGASSAGGEFFDRGMRRVLDRAAPRLAAAQPVTDADRAALAASTLTAERAATAVPEDEAALVAAVYADPRDDAPRLVLADALSQRGDPRGEFLALDMMPTRTTADDRRRGALLKAHGKSWISGELRRAINTSTLRWQRGFPAAAALKTHRASCRDLATLRELDLASLYELPLFEPENHGGLESVVCVPAHLAGGLRERAIWPVISRVGLTASSRSIDEMPRLLAPIVHDGVRGIAVSFADSSITRVLYATDGLFDAMLAIVRWVDRERPHVDRLEVGGIARYERAAGGQLALARVGIPWTLRRTVYPTVPNSLADALAARWHAWIASCTGDILLEGTADDVVRAARLPFEARVREVRRIAPFEPLVP
jgi:uncharacterized protein (TIGR02996 family)|nr:TIGR02996 domain-containing protein [Kofleriaceae bacterium]